MELDSTTLDSLIQEIERIRRRKIVDYSNKSEIEYIDPFENLEKVKQLNNHLIIGRRGSGKTTLLLTTISDGNNNILHPRDCQIFRSWEKEKILLSILEKLFSDLLSKIDSDQNFKTAETEFKKNCKGFVNSVKNNFSKSEKYKQCQKNYSEFLLLILTLRRFIEYLKRLSDLPNEIVYKRKGSTSKTSKYDFESSQELKLIGSLKTEGKLKGSFANLSTNLELVSNIQSFSKRTMNQSDKTEESFEHEVKFEKFLELNERLLDFSSVFSEYTRLTTKNIILYLDDYYLIPTSIQPFIAQFLHDIYKNSEHSAFCFKICTLPNRIKLNVEGSVDFSYKDDFSPIKLDKELSDLNNLKDYLIKIVVSLKPDLNILPRDLIGLFNNDEVLLYTVIATGGVPRDFLISFAELIREARTDSRNIKKEHLYSVISNLKEDKDNNIEVDADIDPEIIKKAVGILEKEVVEGLKTNVVLYPLNLSKEHESILKNLINLRYIHVINENISSEKVKKESFVAYLIDMTFYATGKRLKPGFDFREFWIKNADSHYPYLRNAPIWNFKNEDILTK